MKNSDKKYFSEGFETVITRSLDEIEAIRPVWEEMQRSEPYPVINADVDRYLSVIQGSNRRMQPYIILIKQECEPIAMLIARIEKFPVKLKLGYKTLLSPSLRCLRVAYGGILGQPTNDVSSLLIGELLRMLRNREVDMVYLNHLRVESCVYKLSRTLPGVLNRSYFHRKKQHWLTSVPPSTKAFHAFLSASRKRYLKRYVKKLENECGGSVRLVCYQNEADIDSYIQIASRIAHGTYKERMGVGFADTFLNRSLMANAALKGLWKGYVLYTGDRPCAFEYGTRYSTTYFPENIAYDPHLSSCSPGTVLFIKVLEDLSKDPQVKTFDFGFGPGKYKDRFGTEYWTEASVQIFAPRLYPIFINIVRTLTTGLNRGLEYTLNKTGLTDWTKRRWRNLLQNNKKH